MKIINCSDVKFDVFIRLSFTGGFFKLIVAFSTNKCGFGNGLYEILPEDFR